MAGSKGMVIAGGGISAVSAANALRDEGWSGAITLISDEPHTPYDRPPLSKSFVTDAGASVPYLTDQLALADRKIGFIQSTAIIEIDRQRSCVKLSDGQHIFYEKLLIATGARPRRLTLPGSDCSRVRYLRTVDDSRAIGQQLLPGAHMIVIGGGFIGLELASSARKRGASVTLIESLPRILSRGVPLEIAQVVASRHELEGVNILCSALVSEIVNDTDTISVRLADGQTIAGDLVVAGIGSVPETGLAVAAGLAVENGICVDAHMQTSDPDIYAAGDCVSFPLASHGDMRVRLESWRNAQDQGALAAVNMLGQCRTYDAIPWFWSDQYDLSLQITGLHSGQDRPIRRDLGNGAFIVFHLDQKGCLTSASGIGVGNAVARDIRLAEMLIARGVHPPEEQLVDGKMSLKALLKAAAVCPDLSIAASKD